MIRTAIYFGLWTIACMIVTIGGFFLIGDLADPYDSLKQVFSRDNPSWPAAGFLMMFSPVAGVVATLLWMFFHRGGRQPGWLIYGLIALLVIFISHMVVFGGMFSIGSERPLETFVGTIVIFAVHGWLSVPIAILGTALFVLWNRRRTAIA
jgi:hypothetical protein